MRFFTTAALLLFSTGAMAERRDSDYYYHDYNADCRSPRKEVMEFMKAYGTNYQKALFDAAKYGYYTLLEPLIKCGARVNGADNDGKTALTFAAKHGNFRTCRRLIILGANVNAETIWGSTPLMWAAQNGHKKACRILLEDGAKISARTHIGKDALMYAAENGHIDTCKLLVQHGAKVNARANSGKTVLEFAKGHSDVSDFLRKAGASSHSVVVPPSHYSDSSEGGVFLAGLMVGILFTSTLFN